MFYFAEVHTNDERIPGREAGLTIRQADGLRLLKAAHLNWTRRRASHVELDATWFNGFKEYIRITYHDRGLFSCISSSKTNFD